MFRSLKIFSVVILVFAYTNIQAQQNVFSRSDANTNLWWNDTPSNYPWFYSSSDNNQNRPDNLDRHYVFIGHNNNNPMNVNGAVFQLRTFTVENSVSIVRTYTANSGGEISLSQGLYNNSNLTQIFNVPIRIDGPNVEFVAINGSLSFTSNFSLNGNQATFAGGNSTLIEGIIQGSGGIVKNDSGVLNLEGTNTFTGTTIINNGTVIINNNDALGSTSAGTTVFSGATLELGTLSNVYENLILNGTGGINGALRKLGSGDINYFGNITLQSDARINVILSNLIHRDANLDLNGQTLYLGGNQNFVMGPNLVVQNATKTSGDGAIFKDGVGYLLLRPNPTLTGTINLFEGEIRLADNLPVGSNLVMHGGTILSSNSTTSRTISKNIILAGNIFIGGTVASRNGELNFAGGFDLGGETRSIELIFSNRISGIISNGGINKAGAGTLTLSGANTYSGATIVSAGALQLGAANTLPDASNIQLSGGILRTGTTTGFSDQVGTLQLTANSTIALGTGSHDLTFANSSGVTWTNLTNLTITGWQGVAGSSGTAGRIFIGNNASGLTQSQLDKITFSGYDPGVELLSTGELVPRPGTISINSFTGAPFSLASCSSTASGSLTYSITGTFNSGNQFIVQLSDGSGDFSQPLNIGSLNSTTGGTIAFTIPENIPSGLNYAIRIRSTNPAINSPSTTPFAITQNGNYCPELGDYRSIASGTWITTSIWEKYVYNSSQGIWTWQTATSSPDDGAESVYIRNGHTITYSQSLQAVDNLIIESGGKLFTNSSSNTYLNVAGDVVCDGIIGNGSTPDGISFNIQEGFHLFSGAGAFDCSRIRLSNENTTGKNVFRGDADLSIDIDINLRWQNVDTTNAIYSNADIVNSIFNITVLAGNTLSITEPNGAFGMDGTSDSYAPSSERRGTYTVYGTIDCAGVYYAGSNNNPSNQVVLDVKPGGVVRTKIIDYGASNTLNGGLISIENGGLLEITGANSQNNPWQRTSTGSIDFQIESNSSVIYSRLGNQNIPDLFDYPNLSLTGSGTKTILTNGTAVNGELTVSGSAQVGALANASLSFAQNFTLGGSGGFEMSAYDHLNLSTSGENDQTITGNSNPVRCFNFSSAKSSGSLTFSTLSAFETKGEWNTDYYTNGDFTNNGTTLRIGGNMRLRGGDPSRYSVTGEIRLTGETGSVQVFRGTGDSPVSAVIEDLFITGATSNVDLATSGNYTFSGDINIENGQLNAFSNQINIGGNWSNYNQTAFNENVARINFNGTSDQLITCPGGEIFSSLSIGNNSGSVRLINNLNVTGINAIIVDFSAGSTLDLNGNVFRFNGNNGSNIGTDLRVSGGISNVIGTNGSTFEIVNGRKAIIAQSGGELQFGPGVNVQLRNGLNCGASGITVIQGSLEITDGGYVDSNPPIYFTNSTLRYTVSGNFDRNSEWNALSDAGYPYNIEVLGTNLYLSNFSLPGALNGKLEIAGDLLIDNGGTLFMGSEPYNGLEVFGTVTIGNSGLGNIYLGDVFGADLFVGVDFIRNSGNIITNSREVVMNGASDQEVTGISNLDYFAVAKPSGVVNLNSDLTLENRLRLSGGMLNLGSFSLTMTNDAEVLRNASGGTMSNSPIVNVGEQYRLTYENESFTTGLEWSGEISAVSDVRINGSITTSIGANRTFNRDLILDGSDLNLNGNILTARGRVPEASGFSGTIEVRGGGTRNIIGGALSYFDITGLGDNSPADRTKTVSTFDGSELVFGPDVTVRIGDGQVDFGESAGFYPTTINGTLEVLLGGSVGIFLNPCYFGIGSTLRFTNGVDFQVDNSSKTWASGEIFSGDPGIPWDVEVGANTELVLNAPRALRNDLRIINGVFSLTSSSGTFELGGNWIRSGMNSAFNHLNQKVVFNGTNTQTITTSDGVAMEEFYKLTFSNTGTKTLNEDVSVLDSLRITENAILDQNGNTIFLAGNWTNTIDDLAFIESGMVRLNGDGEQRILNAGGEEIFDILQIDNSSELNEGITLGSDTRVSGSLILTKGLVHTEPTIALILSETASNSGGTYRSFVNGLVRKQGFSTSSFYIIPTGDFEINGPGDTTLVHQPAAISPQSANSLLTFDVQYFHENAVPGTNYPSNPPAVESSLITASTCNHWEITRSGAPIDAILRLYWNDSTTCFDIEAPSLLRVARWNESIWEDKGYNGFSSVSPFTSGYVESAIISDFSPFAIATSGSNNALPITLLSFQAEVVEASVRTKWATASEINNDFFTVERSKDGIFWEKIGFVDGAGNSNAELQYSFTDENPFTGISYYRLRQTDFDGTSTLSDPQAVEVLEEGEFGIDKVYRGEDGINLVYRSTAPYLVVEIFDIVGKRVHAELIENYGNGFVTLYPDLAKGTYVVRLSHGSEMDSEKVVY